MCWQVQGVASIIIWMKQQAMHFGDHSFDQLLGKAKAILEMCVSK
jgi:hypothetical protein